MKLRIVTLSENTASRQNLLAEWGLSILLETGEANVLLDSGATISAVHNADALDIDLKKIDKIVLSHGHQDHSGGLRTLLQRMKKEVEVIAHPDIWQLKYGRSQNEPDRFSGIPFRVEGLESLGARFRITKEPVRISPNITTTGEVPMVTEFEQIDARLYTKESSGWVPDKLMDDKALVVTTEMGLVIILGCAHRGIINTIYHAQKLTGIKQIHTVVGGCHLYRASKERIEKTISALKEMNVQKLGVSHCTGMPASVMMAHEFGDKFFFNNAGTVTKIPEEK